jgi:hypothetical protein
MTQHYLTSPKFESETRVEARDVLFRVEEIEAEGTAARDSADGFYVIRFLHRGYGAGPTRVVVRAPDPDVAQAIVIGSGMAVPGTVHDAEPAGPIDAELVNETREGIYPVGALDV